MCHASVRIEAGRQGGRAAADHPVDQRADRHPQTQTAQRGRPTSTGAFQRPQRHPRRRAPGAGAAARRAPASAERQLAAEHGHAQQDQHERQRARRRGVEAELELGEDRHGERLVLDDLKSAVLGQQAERHEQAAAQHRRRDLAQRHPPERPPWSQPETASNLLQGRVYAARRGGDRQVHERIQRQRHDQHRGQVSVQPRLQRDPAEAHDEVGDAERQHQCHRPQAPAGQRRALHAPGARHADHRAQSGARERQAHGVPQQHRGVVAQQQTFDFPPARLQGLVDQEDERQQHQPGARAGRRRRSPAASVAAPTTRAPNCSARRGGVGGRLEGGERAHRMLAPTTGRASARVPAARGRCPGRRS